MKKLIAIIALAWLPLGAMAAGGAKVELQPANISLSNEASIQRGAKMFMNYCMGCHSAQYARYNLLTNVGLSEDEIKDNLIFNADAKVGDLMTIAMPEADAAAWFGAPPPDLTLNARIRHNGADWLYSYLKSFYVDESRPMGVNNTVFPNVGMPHVLWELQGIQKAVYKDVQHGNKVEKVVERLELVEPGTMTPAEYDSAVRDLTTFLVYLSEPVKLERQALGIWVLLFLAVFTVIAYLLKKNYWQDVH
jgi:ubiquinol-cytochrome c reductase cytochrome c1 subunit